MLSPLTEEERALLPQQLPHWEMRDEKLHRDFRFPDFVHAFAFMTQVALLAEKMAHHPEWSNVYNQVSISLTTHDAGGVSKLDLELARQIDALASENIR